MTWAGAAELPRSATALRAAIARTDITVAESIARRYVATHPEDRDGWTVLLDCVEQTGNPPETVRVARLALERFADLPRARLLLAGAVAQAGRLDEAAGLLSGRQLTAEEALLLAELALVVDPDEARRLFAEIVRAAPTHPVAALGLRSATGLAAGSPRGAAIALLLAEDWHGWIQASIADAFDQAGVPYLAVTRPWLLAHHRPRVIVLSGPSPPLVQRLRLLVPDARLVNTRHSLTVTGKNYGLYAACACDHVCVSSESQALRTRDLALLPEERVWVTGYPQMDGLFRRLRAEPRRLPGRRVVFAPTYNPELSAAFLVGDDPVTAIRAADESIGVVLAPHPLLRRFAPAMLAAWRRTAAERPGVVFHDPTAGNLVATLADADVVVSDVSAVAIQFLATDRPIVRLVDPARARTTPAFSLDGEEWELATAATTVERGADLAAAVRGALDGAEPPPAAAGRARLRERLFGSLTDGRAGERIAERIAGLVAGGRPHGGDA